MIHNGRIPYTIHAIVDYLGGALLVAAPFVFGFSGTGSATAVSIVLGVIVLCVAASTTGRTGLTSAIPISVHVVVDLVVGVAAIAAPFVFGFTGNGTATPFFIVLGVCEILLLIGTRYPGDRRQAESAAP